jgi:hypothetical protein
MGLIAEKRTNGGKSLINSKDLDFILSNVDRDQEQSWGYDLESLAASCLVSHSSF